MPDFTVIDGGGKRHDYDADAAQDSFEDLITELLRAVARGNDSEHRIIHALNRFIEHASAADMAAAKIIATAIGSTHKSIFDEGLYSDYERDLMAVARHSLRVAAEKSAKDSAAKGRRSKREDGMVTAIEQFMLGQEERSRSHHWSYLANLAERRFGKSRPQPKTSRTHPTRSKTTKRDDDDDDVEL